MCTLAIYTFDRLLAYTNVYASAEMQSDIVRKNLQSLRKCNEEYGKKEYPIAICCEICSRWRLSSKYEENWDVPATFNCSMWITPDGQQGNCDIPSVVDHEVLVNDEYTPGSLVWAKMKNFPIWPAMVEDDPDNEQYCVELETNPKYHVVFLGPKTSRRWMSAKSLKPLKISSLNEIKNSNIKTKELRLAVESAEKAINMTKQKRLMTFSFAEGYKGQQEKLNKTEESVSGGKKRKKSAEVSSPQKSKKVPTEESMSGVKKRKKSTEVSSPQKSKNVPTGTGSLINGHEEMQGTKVSLNHHDLENAEIVSFSARKDEEFYKSKLIDTLKCEIKRLALKKESFSTFTNSIFDIMRHSKRLYLDALLQEFPSCDSSSEDTDPKNSLIDNCSKGKL